MVNSSDSTQCTVSYNNAHIEQINAYTHTVAVIERMQLVIALMNERDYVIDKLLAALQSQIPINLIIIIQEGGK